MTTPETEAPTGPLARPAPGAARLIENDAFQFEFVSELAAMESWRKEVYRPIYHVHKWWAKRLGSVFRAVLLGSVLPDSEDLAQVFYRAHSFSGLTVFDPFMGSGTTIGEAHKLGFTALGRDINPVACEAVRVALGPLDRDALMQAFGRLSATVGERIRRLYQTTDAEGHLCDALYYFWVKTLPCPHCTARVDLFPSSIFARNAYPDRKPEVRVYCPHCAAVFPASVRDQQVACPSCAHRFDPHHGPAEGASATCTTCSKSFAIAKVAKAQGRPPGHRLFAKLVLTSRGDKLYLPVTREDEAAYQRCTEELARSNLPLPTLELAHGYNTRQVLNYAYRTWRDFFNDRQLLALGWLHQALVEIPDEPVRDAMLTVFSGALEFNNTFASYKGEGTGAVRHMFAHHILKPERVPIEGNVWGTSKSSGSFSTLFKTRLFRAIDYRAAPFEVAVKRGNGKAEGRRVFGTSAPFTGRVSTQWPPLLSTPNRPLPSSDEGRGQGEGSKVETRAIYLSCGNSAGSGLPDTSVDLVVTDPPFFDNVHYSELADFFHAWQQLRPGTFAQGQATTRHADEVQDVSAQNFAAKLKAVFAECHRVLKDDGLLVFSYHHSRAEGWSSLAEAVVGAGFTFINAHPVKGEMSVAAPKAQAKEPIQLDIIMVCRKRHADQRGKAGPEIAFTNAVARAKAKLARLRRLGLGLSLNDHRVVLMSQFLVELCPQRKALELLNTLDAKLEGLELALRILSEQDSDGSSGIWSSRETDTPEAQLVLLEQPSVMVAPGIAPKM
jgi:putative DNA methylase